MGYSVHWHFLAVLIGLLCSGGEVLCDCTAENIQIDGGTYRLTKQLTTGSLLVYECPESLYPYPHLTRTCQPSGNWSPSPNSFNTQRCKVVECPNPNVLLDGSVYPAQDKYFVGNETTYECYSAYTLRGSMRRVCLANGMWSGQTPICSRDRGNHCADPGVPAGAARSGNSFRIGDTVRYRCNNQLLLMGSEERVCQENSQWTGTEPSCHFPHTYDAAVSQEFDREIKNRLTNLKSVNGTLNIYIAVDISESIEPDYVKKATQAIEQIVKKISSFAVKPNYDVIFFSSEIYQVVSILDSYGGVEVDVVQTLKNFELSDKHSGSDLNGAFYHFLERMAFIKFRVTAEKFKDHYHVVIVFTDGQYNMGGQPVRSVTRMKDLVYMNDANDRGNNTREEHLDVYLFGIGAEIFTDDLKSLRVGTGGEHFFQLGKHSNLEKVFGEIIDETEVRSQCGLNIWYEDGASDQKKYPWAASITIMADGRRRSCLGSLITPQFVLTAAHCFRFYDLPENVNVHINDRPPIWKRVKNFYLHPKYNVSAKVNEGVKEFYDYDVALILLEEAVETSVLARPICIPCTRETSAALKLPPGSTCSQQRAALLKAQGVERLHFLTKSHGLHQKTVLAKLGDSRAECIHHALQAYGVTTWNPEVPVTRNFLCTGGLVPERDHIACTGDGGGAVFKNFEHRTVQVGVVSWGTRRLCDGGGLVESSEESRDFHINLFDVADFLKAVLANDAQDDFEPLVFLEN